MLRKLILGLALLGAGIAAVAWLLSAPAVRDYPAATPGDHRPGTVIAVERLGGHNRLVLRALLWWADLPVSAPVVDGAAMFRVRYWSAIDGKPVEASGLLGIPYRSLAGAPPRGTALYFHGTSPDRRNSPSAPGPQEGLLPVAIFAGGGYTLLAPDYFGLGQSRAGQAYMHTAATVAASRDLIIAARHVASALQLGFSPDLYLVGFSQGGHATAVVQRALEAAPVPGTKVRAAAAIAGAYDLAGISIPYAFAHKHSLYLAYLAHSYAVQYHQPLDSLLAPAYAAKLPGLFDGDHTVDVIDAALPADPRALFRPDRLAELLANQPNWFTAALAENQGFRWRPVAPLRLYFGFRDTDVSPQDSQHFHAVAARIGGNVTLVPLGPYDHVESALRGVPMARLWFDELSQPKT